MYIDVFMLTNRPAENVHAIMQGKSYSEFVVANTLANDKSRGLMELTITQGLSLPKLASTSCIVSKYDICCGVRNNKAILKSPRS